MPLTERSPWDLSLTNRPFHHYGHALSHDPCATEGGGASTHASLQTISPLCTYVYVHVTALNPLNEANWRNLRVRSDVSIHTAKGLSDKRKHFQFTMLKDVGGSCCIPTSTVFLHIHYSSLTLPPLHCEMNMFILYCCHSFCLGSHCWACRLVK